jgi:hypothetical protein
VIGLASRAEVILFTNRALPPRSPEMTLPARAMAQHGRCHPVGLPGTGRSHHIRMYLQVPRALFSGEGAFGIASQTKDSGGILRDSEEVCGHWRGWQILGG